MPKTTLTLIFNGTGENALESDNIMSSTWKSQNVNGKLATHIQEVEHKAVTMPQDKIADVTANHTACVLNGIGTQQVASNHSSETSGLGQSWLQYFNVPYLGRPSEEYDRLNSLLITVTGASLENTKQTDGIMSASGAGRLYNTQRAILWLYKRLSAEIEPIDNEIELNVIGWSRGATSAIYFMSCVGTLITEMNKISGNRDYPIINSVLFDPVYGGLSNEYEVLAQTPKGREKRKYGELNIVPKGDFLSPETSGYLLNQCPVGKIALVLSLHEKRQNFKPQTLASMIPAGSQKILNTIDSPIVEIGFPGIHDDQATSVGGLNQAFKDIFHEEGACHSHNVAADLVARVFSLNHWRFSMTTNELLSAFDHLADPQHWQACDQISESIGILAKLKNESWFNKFKNMNSNDALRSLSRTAAATDMTRESVYSPRDTGYYSINQLHLLLMYEARGTNDCYSFLFKQTQPDKLTDLEANLGFKHWYQLNNTLESELLQNYKIPTWFKNLYI